MFGFGKKQEPVFVENELGKFKLVETKSMIFVDGKKRPQIHKYYDGNAVWHGAEGKVSATVRCNKDPNAERGFARLKWAVNNSAKLERRLIDYTFDYFVNENDPNSPIEIWSAGYDDESDECPAPIPPEEFKKHISVNFICIEDDETISAEMDLDGLFTDHGFMVDIDRDGNLSNGALWG